MSDPTHSLRQVLTRNVVPVVLGLGLFGAGLWALYRLLHKVHFADVIHEMKVMPGGVLAIALLTTTLAYLALIGYDWWALRYLEKKLPLRAVLLGGFLGYAFGNTIGVSVISGGAVRYRIYSAFGLNAFEVAALSSYIALAMGIGLTLVGFIALGLHPAALMGLLPFGEGVIRFGALGAAALTLAVLFGLSFSGRTLRLRRFEISMPSPGILVGQLVVALFDSTMAAATLHVLLPAGAPDFVTFLAIYATATMVGVLSHVPGGVGVFETVVIAAMPPGTEVGNVAAALLLFRSIYFLLPFTLAFIVVSLNEARLAGGWAARVFGEVSTPLRPVFTAISGAVPWLVGAWALGLGLYLVAVALMPSVRPGDSDDLVGAILLEGGALVSAVMGIVLVILSQGLLRRVSGAFWLTIAALAGGVVASLLNDLDFGSAALIAAGALILLPFRREFHRRTTITEGVFSPGWFAMIGGLAIAATLFFFFVHEAMPYSPWTLTEFARDANAPRALRAGLAGSAVLLFFTVYLALQPVRRRRRDSGSVAVEKAIAVVEAQDDPQGCLALSGDKDLIFSPAEDAFIMYARQRKSWVAFGDPVGAPESFDALAWDFYEQAQKANCRPVFYEVSARYLPVWIEMGMVLHKVGEEAVVRLPEFSLAGSKFKSMRAAFNKKQREGLALEILPPPHSDEVIATLAEISDAWLGTKSGREKGFSVGRFDAAYLDNFPIAVIRKEGRIVAFANILAPGSGRSVGIDLMRYLPEVADGMMEFLFLSLIEHYRAAGAEEFTLGVAPLAGLSERRTARLWNRFGRLMFRHGGAFYNFEGLRGFKQKFQPEWRPRYIALPPGLSPMVAMADVALLIAGGARGLLPKVSPKAGKETEKPRAQ